jgi:Urocanase Rossmann-like domain
MSSAATLSNDTPQFRTLRAFTLLHHFRPDWRGALILNFGLDPQGTAVALASNIAGAVCLSLEQDPATARQALRSGACDFVVNTLDEALRAMKNEVRQHKPLSVGLQDNQSEILDEIFERGVVPQLVTGLTDPAALRNFQTQGAILVTDVEVATLLASIAEENQWIAQDFPQPTSSALKSFRRTTPSVAPRWPPPPASFRAKPHPTASSGSRHPKPNSSTKSPETRTHAAHQTELENPKSEFISHLSNTLRKIDGERATQPQPSAASTAPWSRHPS